MATLGEYLRDRFREAIGGGVADAGQTLTNAAVTGARSVHVDVFPPTSSLATMVAGIAAIGGGLLGGTLAAGYSLVQAAESAGGPIGIGVAAGEIIGMLLGPALRPMTLPIEHLFGDLLQTEIFDPDTAARLETKGLLDHQAGRSEAAGGNLAGDHYDKLVEDARHRPDLAQLLTLHNFGQLSDAELDAELQVAGFDQAMFGRLKELARQLLSGPDLALANLRGHLDQSTMNAYAQQLGITPADMQLLVDNTGEPPGPEQLMEAFRRGFIDDARFQRGIRQSRVRNEWIDVERNLAHGPMSVAEAARAVVENYISLNTGGRIAEQNGLLPAHWPIIVESWGRPLAHGQMLELYHRGQATRGQVDQAMRESDIKNKYTQQSFELGRTLLPVRQVVTMLQHGTISPTLAARKLLEEGYTDADAQLLISLGTHEHQSTAKELTKTDILGLLRDQLIDKASATSRLEKLGYSAQVAGWLVALEQAKVHAAELRATQSQIKASLLAHRLSPEEAIGQLVSAGVHRDQAAAQVNGWTRARGAITRQLSEAQIVSAATHQALTPGAAFGRLIQLGYSRADATVLLETHGFTQAQINTD